MVRTWLLLLVVFSAQEITSTAAALLVAQHVGLNLWLVHALWFSVIAAEVALSFWLGKLVRRKYTTSKLARWAERFAERWQGSKAMSREFTLFLLNFLNFPFPTTFVSPWFHVPFASVFVWSMLGNLAWYLLEWLIVLGVIAWAPNFITALAAIIAVGLVITLTILILRKNTGIMR